MDTDTRPNTFRYGRLSEKETWLGKTIEGTKNAVKFVLNAPTNLARTGALMLVKNTKNIVMSVINPLRFGVKK